MDTPEQIAENIIAHGVYETANGFVQPGILRTEIVNALTAERQRADEAVAHNAVLREALDKCSDLFSKIRGDWTDPRIECRVGQSVIAEALSITPAASLDALTQGVRMEVMEKIAKQCDAIVPRYPDQSDPFSQGSVQIAEYLAAAIRQRAQEGK